VPEMFTLELNVGIAFTIENRQPETAKTTTVATRGRLATSGELACEHLDGLQSSEIARNTVYVDERHRPL
jgi:hypothetical protein